MSFSTTTKSELARLNTDRPCCRSTELRTFLEIIGVISTAGGKASIVMSSENASIARKIYKLSKDLLAGKPVISVSRRSNFKKNKLYNVRIPLEDSVLEKLAQLGVAIGSRDKILFPNTAGQMSSCCSKVFLRSAFLGGGSIINPQRTYHLEITSAGEEYAQRIADEMRDFDLKPGISKRKQWFVVYLKEADQIAHFLNVIGAHTALLNLESVRTVKGMRNKVNRLINCETANITKSINASLNQIENIKLIQMTLGLERLPASLNKIAVLRLENPDASLKELGEMLDPPVGKSGINHRMRKLEQIADKLRDRQ